MPISIDTLPISGVAGTDYSVYASVPETGFDCNVHHKWLHDFLEVESKINKTRLKRFKMIFIKMHIDLVLL